MIIGLKEEKLSSVYRIQNLEFLLCTHVEICGHLNEYSTVAKFEIALGNYAILIIFYALKSQ